MATTIRTLTDQQIRTLRAEAITAGDLAQIIVCDRALGGTDTADDYMTPDAHERRAVERALAMSQDEARAAVVEAIREAQARDDRAADMMDDGSPEAQKASDACRRAWR